MTEPSASRRTNIAGPLLMVTSAVASVVLLLQPWASCEYEDSSFGCGVPDELMGWTFAGWALIMAALVGGVLLTVRAARRRG
ncbi:hypothetical protein ACFS33_08660 [Cellulomonas phragmiteti]|uniref:Uncharacterized protein n=1 Tax=Cellulomonas phragmiteti TaxID=478780 RepID=A0ABQ4DP54_9CELL|nr:hypothetical protein Cph01nite_28800 [Cellulomonas phragmiteti]